MAIQVLVVEDDGFLMSAYHTKLEHEGFDVEIARDGEEALEVLKTLRPDIILLDLVMPRKDGFATLAEIKQVDAIKDIPVIVTSNLGQEESIAKAKSLGAEDFMTKSNFSMSELVAKINATVNKKR